MIKVIIESDNDKTILISKKSRRFDGSYHILGDAMMYERQEKKNKIMNKIQDLKFF